MENSLGTRRKYFGLLADGQNPEEFVNDCIKRKESGGEENIILDKAYSDVRKGLEQIDKIKVRGINFLLTHLFLIIFSIVGLLFCKALDKHVIISVLTILVLLSVMIMSYRVMRNLFFALFEMENEEYKKRRKEIWQELHDKWERRLIRILKYFRII